MSGQTNPACASCGSEDVAPVVYGLPTPEMHTRAAEGAIVLGGCLRDDDVSWRCRSCGKNLRLPRRPAVVTVWENGTSTEEIVAWLNRERLDPASGPGADYGQERNWDGQTHEEYLDGLQLAHDDGAVMVDDGVWRAWDDAVTDLGIDRTTELRQAMADYLSAEWHKLDGRAPGPPRPTG